MMMQLAPHRTRALTGRVLRQLRADPRFVAASLIVPLIITFLLKVFFDAIDVPMFDQTRFAIPATAFIVHFVTYILTALVLVVVLGAVIALIVDIDRPTGGTLTTSQQPLIMLQQQIGPPSP